MQTFTHSVTPPLSVLSHKGMSTEVTLWNKADALLTDTIHRP
jgi:hypothetical protein